MARLFSFANWNIEHFVGRQERLDQIMNGYSNFIVLEDYNAVGLNVTFSDKYMADADHVFASDHLDIGPGDQGFGMSVRGWPELQTDAAKGRWINELSDHAMIYGEVHV